MKRAWIFYFSFFIFISVTILSWHSWGRQTERSQIKELSEGGGVLIPATDDKSILYGHFNDCGEAILTHSKKLSAQEMKCNLPE